MTHTSMYEMKVYKIYALKLLSIFINTWEIMKYKYKQPYIQFIVN